MTVQSGFGPGDGGGAGRLESQTSIAAASTPASSVRSISVGQSVALKSATLCLRRGVSWAVLDGSLEAGGHNPSFLYVPKKSSPEVF